MAGWKARLMPRDRAAARATDMLRAFHESPDRFEGPEHLEWFSRFGDLTERGFAEVPRRAAGVFHAWAEAEWERGDLERAEQLLDRAMAVLAAQGGPDDGDLLAAAMRRALWSSWRGRHESARASVTAARRDVEQGAGLEGWRRALALAHTDLMIGRVDFERGDFDASDRAARNGLARLGDDSSRGDSYREGMSPTGAGPSAPDDALAMGAASLAPVLWKLRAANALARGRADDARAAVDAGLRRWGEGMGRAARLGLELQRVTIALLEGEVVRARSELDDLAALITALDRSGAARDRKQRAALITAAEVEGMLARREEQLDRAIARFEDASRTLEQALGDPGRAIVRAPRLHAQLGACLASTGRVDEGLALARTAMEAARDVPGPIDVRLVVMRSLGEALMMAGEMDSAHAALQSARDGYRDRFGPAHAMTVAAETLMSVCAVGGAAAGS